MSDAPRPAAGLILLRDAPGIEVLLTERHSAISFAGGALVFPGGRVDAGDFAEEWRAQADGFEVVAPDARPAAVAAVREAFEEAGVLVAREASGELCGGERCAFLRRRWRSSAASDGAFLAMVRSERLRLALDLLVPFARWIAPPGVHKRFDTRFFACLAPRDQSPEPDGEEAVKAEWRAPRAALADNDARAVKLIFPTRRKLELLATSATAVDALEAAASRPCPPIMPSVELRNGEPWLRIPDGLGYPVTEEPLSMSSRG